MKFEIVKDEKLIESQILDTNQVQVLNQLKSFDWTPESDGTFTVRLDNSFYQLYNVQLDGSKVSFQHKGHLYQFVVKDEMAILMDKMGFKDAVAASAGLLKAPMPGKIAQLLVQVGDSVKVGQALIILEAMKMENELKSTIDGTVKHFAVVKGQSVEKNELLLEIE